MKYRIVIDRSFGRIELEAESLEEILKQLQSFPEWMTVIDQSIIERALAPEPKDELKGIVEFTVDGPAIIVPMEKINSKEAIGLLLYSSGPDGLEPKEISRLLSLSGLGMAGYAARMSEMKREGLILREGDKYRLSVRGRSWVEEVVSRLRA
jgi:hypothetical protein